MSPSVACLYNPYNYISDVAREEGLYEESVRKGRSGRSGSPRNFLDSVYSMGKDSIYMLIISLKRKVQPTESAIHG
jgi:hypothetical protein